MSHEFKRQARKKLNIVCLYFEDTHEKVYLNDAGNIINPLKQQSLKSQFSLPSSASNELNLIQFKLYKQFRIKRFFIHNHCNHLIKIHILKCHLPIRHLLCNKTSEDLYIFLNHIFQFRFWNHNSDNSFIIKI